MTGSAIAVSTPGTGPTGAAIAFVEEGWDFFEDKINALLARTLDMVDELSFVPTVEPVTFDVDFPDVGSLTGFHAPTAPTLLPVNEVPISVPEAPDLALPPVPTATEAPAFDVAAPPTISLPQQPGDMPEADLPPAPVLADLAVPDAPLLPDLPTLLELDMPLPPEVATFTGQAPSNIPRLPDIAGASFTEAPYTPTVLAPLAEAVRRGLASGQLLDVSIEQALFARSRDRVLQGNRAALQQIDETYSGRGFKEPPGAWRAAHAEQVEKNQGAINDANRDQTIQLHTQAIESVKFAVTQGIALEQVLIAQHGQIMDRALQSARLLLDGRVALYNADVARYNGELEAFKVNAENYRQQLQSAIDRYRATVEGQQAIGDFNRAAAEAYAARIRALVDGYQGAINGVQAKAGIERDRIEAWKGTIQAEAERVNLYTARWGGFRAAVEAQQAGFRNFEIGTQAYTARINGWAAGEQAKTARYEASVRGSTARYDGYRARIQGVVAQLQAQESRISAITAQNEARTRLFSAEAQVETARSDANTRAFQAVTEAATNRANVKLREAEIKIQDAARVLTAQVESIRGAAQALAQLTSSAMSAVSFNTGVNASGSESMAWSYSWSKAKGWSYGGETPDSPSPDAF